MRAGQVALDVAFLEFASDKDVGPSLLVQQWRAWNEVALRIGDRAERLVFDVDQLHRVLGEIAGFGNHRRDGLANITNLSGGERQDRRGVVVGHARERDHRLEVADDIVGREHVDHARRRLGLAHLDPHDQRVRLRTAPERHMQRAVRLAIGRIFAIAGEQSRVFGPPDRHADVARSHEIGRLGDAVLRHRHHSYAS